MYICEIPVCVRGKESILVPWVRVKCEGTKTCCKSVCFHSYHKKGQQHALVMAECECEHGCEGGCEHKYHGMGEEVLPCAGSLCLGWHLFLKLCVWLHTINVCTRSG